MKTLFLSSLFLAGACLLNPKQDNLTNHISLIDSVSLKLAAKKEAIDHYIETHTKQVIVLVKVPGNKNLLAVKNDRWPDEIEYTYDIYKNQAEKIIFIAQIPFSESGDWDIVYKHYFDEQGNTFAFCKQESIFNDDVKGSIVRAILLNYYDENFNKVSQITKLTDKDYRTIKKNKNDYDFREYKYSIYKNINECLSGYNIKLTR
jgi:hypothetical protein